MKRGSQGWLDGFFRPVGYARSREAYRPPPALYRRLSRRLGPAATSLGIVPADVITLEVPGRRSGVIRRTTMVRAGCDGGHYLVSLAGESDWVRNVRAAGGRVVIAGRHRRAARLTEVGPQQRAPVIRAYLLRWGRRPGSAAVAREARSYFGVGAAASLADIQHVVDHYPVFRIEYVGQTDPAGRLFRQQPPRSSRQPRQVSWNATQAERAVPLPGDDLVPAPMLQATHAVTIDAPPQQVWPWLVQTGQGRAGFYSDSRFWDRCVDWYYRRLSRQQPGQPAVGYQVTADDKIVAAWQNPQVGDIIADGPPGTACYVVRHAEQGKSLVLFTDTHLPCLLPARLRDNSRLGISGEISDSFLLTEPQPGTTRLIRRMRLSARPWPFRAYAVPIVLIWGEAITARHLLRGIKRRAESHPRPGPACQHLPDPRESSGRRDAVHEKA